MEITVYANAEGKPAVIVKGESSPEAAAQAYLSAMKVLTEAEEKEKVNE